MLSLTSIVAVGLGGEIGVQNRLPWQLKSDLRFFQRTTKGNVVIMGRKTYDSIGKCLPQRENIVLSHRLNLFESHPGCHHSHGVGETLHVRQRFPKREAFVIGGAQTYAQFAPLVDRYLITFVGASFPDADAFFDRTLLGTDDYWDETEIPVELVDAGKADEFPFRVMELRHKNPDLVMQRREAALAEFQSRNHRLHRKALERRVKAGIPLAQILHA